MKNLKEFTANYKFKQAILDQMTDALDDEELENLKGAFQAIDKDGNGTISASEMREALREAGQSGNNSGLDLDTIMKMADVDGDGCISYHELCMASVQRKLVARQERLYQA